MKTKPRQVLFLIVLAMFIFQLYFSFQSDYFYSDESYFHARLVDNIIQEKMIIFFDELSFGGRELITTQLFHIILALLSFIPSALKIMPIIFLSTIPILAYLLAFKMTKNKKASLLSALLTAFLPIIHQETLNQLSPLTLFLPLLLLFFYSFENLEIKLYLRIFVILSFILPFIHPASLILTLTLPVYILLTHSESLKLKRLKKEAALFSFFLILLINFFIYKKAILLYSYQIFWQSTSNIIQRIATDTLASLLMISSISIIFGSIGIYLSIRKKNKASFLLTSFIISTLLLLFLQIIDMTTGFIFLTLVLSILTAHTFSYMSKFTELTKFSIIQSSTTSIMVLIIFFLAILPSFQIVNDFSVDTTSIEDLSWLQKNSDNPVVISPITEGNLITWFGFTNVADTQILLAPNPKERAEDLNSLYATWATSPALRLIHKYNGEYLFISENTKNQYNNARPPYVTENCFKKERETLYKILC